MNYVFIQEFSFREFRFAAYLNFSNYAHGYLGAGIRIEIPACVTHIIRCTFPALDGNYVAIADAEI